MLLKVAPAFSLLNARGDNLGPLFSPVSASWSNNLLSPSIFRSKNGPGFVVYAAKGTGANNKPLTGVVFEPFEEVKKELDLVPTVPQLSLARQKYSDNCEAAVNEQIKLVRFFYGFLFIFSLFRLS